MGPHQAGCSWVGEAPGLQPPLPEDIRMRGVKKSVSWPGQAGGSGRPEYLRGPAPWRVRPSACGLVSRRARPAVPGVGWGRRLEVTPYPPPTADLVAGPRAGVRQRKTPSCSPRATPSATAPSFRALTRPRSSAPTRRLWSRSAPSSTPCPSCHPDGHPRRRTPCPRRGPRPGLSPGHGAGMGQAERPGPRGFWQPPSPHPPDWDERCAGQGHRGSGTGVGGP